MFGDIITYEEDENYFITHRIIEKNSASFITQGDNNNEKDTEITSSKILGKVVFHSIVLGNFIRIYLKYVFMIVTVFVVFMNIYWIDKNKNGKEEICKTQKEKR